jgi:DeoR family glycerol-3-phosphate regulon repressor
VSSRADIGVIGVSGIEADGTLLNYDYREARVTQTLMGQSPQVTMVADHTKFGRHAPLRLGSIEQVNILITALPVLAEAAEAFEEAGVEVIVAGVG